MKTNKKNHRFFGWMVLEKLDGFWGFYFGWMVFWLDGFQKWNDTLLRYLFLDGSLTKLAPTLFYGLSDLVISVYATWPCAQPRFFSGYPNTPQYLLAIISRNVCSFVRTVFGHLLDLENTWIKGIWSGNRIQNWSKTDKSVREWLIG